MSFRAKISPTNQPNTNILHRAQNTTINRAEFNNIGRDQYQNFQTTIASPHRTLWDTIAGVGASHDSTLQFERGSCLPGTREAVLKDVHEWGASDQTPVCWLSGAAGVGKSAIALTVAKSWAENNGLVSSFFFFRSDSKRNNPTYLILSIAYGVFTTRPSLRRTLNQRIAEQPRILEATLEDQFRELVVRPLVDKKRWWKRLRELVLHWSNPTYPSLIVIDGLDECGDSATQQRIISILTSASRRSLQFPLRFFICSRPESWIREVFDHPSTHTLTKRIVLDGSYLPNNDIKRYLLHEFDNIRSDRKYSGVVFPNPWPSHVDFERLILNASGQFIYATTVIKFVKAEYSFPITQLRIILDNLPDQISSESPFSELDSLYRIIVAANPKRDKLLSILSVILLLPRYDAGLEPSLEFIELFLGLSPGEADLSLRAMHSVLDIRDRKDEIQVYHTSFTDYLYSESRSGEFCISELEQRDFLARRWLQVLAYIGQTPHESQSFYSTGRGTILLAKWVDFCCSIKRPSEQLLHDIQSINVLSILIPSSVRLLSSRSTGLDAVWRRQWSDWSSTLQSVSSWLKRTGYVHIKIAEHYANIQDRIQFCVAGVLDNQTRQDLECWVALNITNCRWSCLWTERVDGSIPISLGEWWAFLQLNPLSAPNPPGNAFRDICLRTALLLGRDLRVSIERKASGGKYLVTWEMKGVIANLLGSTLLECCGPAPELLPVFQTIHEVVTTSFRKDWIQELEEYSGRDIFGYLHRWCGTFPKDSRQVLKYQILDLFPDHSYRQGLAFQKSARGHRVPLNLYLTQSR